MKKRYQTQNAVDTRDAFIMLAPFLLLFVFFIVAPVVISIVLGFTYFDMIQMPSFVGLDNYIQLFLNDDGFIKALSNTMVFACITGPICYLISFIVGMDDKLSEEGTAHAYYIFILCAEYIGKYVCHMELYIQRGFIRCYKRDFNAVRLYFDSDSVAYRCGLYSFGNNCGTDMDEPRHRLPFVYCGASEY